MPGSYNGGGIWEHATLNGSWSQIELQGDTVFSIRVTSAGTIWAGTTNGLFQRNSGGTWTGPLFLDESVASLLLKGNDTIIVGLDLNATSFLVDSENLVYESFNGGSSWTLIDYNLADSLDIDGFIALTEDAQGNIFGGTDDGGNPSGGGVYWLPAGTTTWLPLNTGILTDTTTVNVITLVSGVLFAGTDGLGVLASTNSGNSWQQIGLPADVFALTNSSSGAIFAGINGGIYVSNNRGATWTQSGFMATNILALAENTKGVLFAGMDLDFGGLWESTDNGNTWSVDPFMGGYSVISLYAFQR